MTNRVEARHIAVSINRPADEVYAFASNPKNLPKWATGLGGAIRKEGGEWVADSPMGKLKIRFAESNPFGILDHVVVLESGAAFRNPMRVLSNGRRSEIVFTLFRQPGMTDEKFEEDAKWVEKDLGILKELLEKGAEAHGTQPADPIPQAPGKSANKLTVEKYMDGFRRSDHAQILSCLTNDVEWEMPGLFRLAGKDAFDREIENEAFVGNPDINVTRMTEENDIVVAEGSVRVEKKAGGFLNAVFCDVFSMQAGRIRKLTTYLAEVK